MSNDAHTPEFAKHTGPFCTCCLAQGLDPWSDTHEGYTHCCNDRLGYDADEFYAIQRGDAQGALRDAIDMHPDTAAAYRAIIAQCDRLSPPSRY